MAGFLRMLLGFALLPLCWGVTRSFVDAVRVSAGADGAFSAEAISLLGSHPVRTYVLGHELTHALWGLMFGACPSDVRVGATGGSVRLTKTNFLITLAPYFFPFYTFVVVIAALLTYAFLRPLPYLPLWMFLIGFTWAFHVLFTLETLTQRQPDVKLYGRVFSWTFIFLVNVAIVLVWLAATTSLSFSELGSILFGRVMSAYVSVGVAFGSATRWVYGIIRS